MHRTMGDGYIVESGKRIYADEAPPTRDATQLRHQEMNAIQEEICTVVESEGYSLNADTESLAQMNQMNTAINKKVTDAVTLEAIARANADGIEASSRAAADAVLQNQIDNLDSTDIFNVSSVAGSKVTDALNQLQSDITGIGALVDPLYFIAGCGWSRLSVAPSILNFAPGVCLDYTNTELLTMPQVLGAYRKSMSNTGAYAKGDNVNGVPAAIMGSLTAGSQLYVFLCKLGDSSFDIGYDTDIDATNLQADPVAGVTKYRRIGWVQCEIISGNEVRVYQAIQQGNYHKLTAIKKYSVPVASWGAIISGNNIYIPQGLTVRVQYTVFPPSGGASRSLCSPRDFGLSNWQTSGLWMASSDSTYGIYGSAYIECDHLGSNHGFGCYVEPWSGRSCEFGLFGFVDFRGQDGLK